MKGFQPTSSDETKIAIICKRLTPAIQKQDELAFAFGLKTMIRLHDSPIVDRACGELCAKYAWLRDIVFKQANTEQRQRLYAEAYAVMAQTIIDFGLRVEDHFRVSDEGFCLTMAALDAFANYPNVLELGSGSPDLDGMGFGRLPFIHPLSESDPKDPNFVSLWAAASLFISAALGWVTEKKPSPQAMEVLKDAVTRVSPTTDFEKLVSRARYDDRMLLELASLVHEGLTTSRQL